VKVNVNLVQIFVKNVMGIKLINVQFAIKIITLKMEDVYISVMMTDSLIQRAINVHYVVKNVDLVNQETLVHLVLKTFIYQMDNVKTDVLMELIMIMKNLDVKNVILYVKHVMQEVCMNVEDVMKDILMNMESAFLNVENTTF